MSSTDSGGLASSPVTVFAAGDVFNDLPDPSFAFRHLSALLSRADIVFGNSEGVYSDRPQVAPSARVFHGASLDRGSKLAAVPFHVMSCANNHALDGGPVALLDSLALLREQGILTTGAGEDLDTATRPAVVERRGVKVAFLGFCSTFPVGYEARPDRPGLAALRVRTLYRSPDPNFWDPGVEPEIITSPDPSDLARFRHAIAAARASADFVIVACHWGYAGIIREQDVPASSTHRRIWTDGIQDYERELARYAIDHGADAVACHHQLGLRGVTFHHGKPIFHGLGVLVNHFHRPGLGAGDGGEAFPLFPFEPGYRHTGVAVLELTADGSVEAGFIPAQILADGSTEPLRAGDPRGKEIAEHLTKLNADHGFATDITPAERGGWAFLRLRPAGPGPGCR